MGLPSIRKKLQWHLALHTPMKEECHAMYFLVEMRKSCERSDYKDELLKFYADWAVHPRKDRISKSLATTLGALFPDIDANLRARNRSSAVVNFSKMMHLRAAISRWLDHEQILTGLTANDVEWNAFRGLLAGILADQEIALKDPLPLAPNIRAIYFEAQSGICKIRLRTPIRGKKVTTCNDL